MATEAPAGIQSGSPAKVELTLGVFSARQYVIDHMQGPLSRFTDVHFFDARLTPETAKLAHGFDAVCLFVNDDCGEESVRALAECGVRFIAMRCAGYDRVDLAAAARHGLRVVRVPAYSPRSVAEFALATTFTVARNMNAAHAKVMAGNYTLSGLVGMELTGKTFGVVGTGKIGIEFVKLLQPFGGKVLAYDIYPSEEARAAGATYVAMEELLEQSHVVSLHLPLLPSTRHIIGADTLARMRPGALLINVSRGALVDTEALVDSLVSGHLGGAALDVYEEEEAIFFRDFSNLPARERMRVWDTNFAMLKSLPHVHVTPHIAFLTNEALANIAETTVHNLVQCAALEAGGQVQLDNEVLPPKAK